VNNALTALDSSGTLITDSLGSFTSGTAFAAYNTLNTALGTAPDVAALRSNVTASVNDLAVQQDSAFSKIVSIGTNGLITYQGKSGLNTYFYNGTGQPGIATTQANAVIAQRLAIVAPPNVSALEKAGDSLFKQTVGSGVSDTAFSLESNGANGTSEKVFSNSLEQSNVDMAAQFVKMILTQRAYSANSKTITTADEMTQEALNLKR